MITLSKAFSTVVGSLTPGGVSWLKLNHCVKTETKHISFKKNKPPTNQKKPPSSQTPPSANCAKSIQQVELSRSLRQLCSPLLVDGTTVVKETEIWHSKN